MSETTTLRKLLNTEFEKNNDRFENIVYSTNYLELLDEEFDNGFGNEKQPVNIWTKDFVYFTVNYEGSLTIASISLKPTKIATMIQWC